MDDLISRQAAIYSVRAGVLSTTTLYGRTEEGETARKEIERTIKALPSVNPQANNEDIHREREQAYMKGYEDASKRYRTEPCGDAISRVAAIDKLDEWDWQEFYLPIHFKELLDELPPVSVAEKTGHWKIKRASIHPYGNDVACSECGFTMGSSFGYRYCPNCGAKMVEPQESEESE